MMNASDGGGEIIVEDSLSSSSSSSSSPSSSTHDSSSGGMRAPFLCKRWCHALSQRYQHLLDKTTPHVLRRWMGFAVLMFAYLLRIYLVEGYYMVSYALGVYILNPFIAFLSPQTDPIVDSAPGLPIKSSDEFRPFLRRLPEFQFWYSITKAFCVAFLMTFFAIFDVPVFWPILFIYWLVLFTLTMKRQIHHMIKHKYLPFSFGKQRYTGKRADAAICGDE